MKTLKKIFLPTLFLIFMCTFCENLISGPLHDAVNRKDYEEVIEIYKNETIESWNKIINGVDKNGHTPLHLAAFWGCYDIMWFLLINGANVNAVINLEEGHYLGFTPLHCVVWASVAQYAGKLELTKCAMLLLENGADINIQDKRGGKAPCQVVEYLYLGPYYDEVVRAINKHLIISCFHVFEEFNERQRKTRRSWNICDICKKFGNLFSSKRSKEKQN